MKLETILNACSRSRVYLSRSRIEGTEFKRYLRQYDTFRTRILKMDEEKDKRIAYLEGENFYLSEELLTNKQ